MITNKEKKLALSCGKKFVCIITQNIIENKGNFYCLNCLHSFKTENKLKCHEKVCKNIYFFGIVVPPENGNILEFNKCRKSDKMVHIFYPALESLIKEIDGSPKILEKSSTTKIGKHISYRYSMSKI